MLGDGGAEGLAGEPCEEWKNRETDACMEGSKVRPWDHRFRPILSHEGAVTSAIFLREQEPQFQPSCRVAKTLGKQPIPLTANININLNALYHCFSLPKGLRSEQAEWRCGGTAACPEICLDLLTLLDIQRYRLQRRMRRGLQLAGCNRIAKLPDGLCSHCALLEHLRASLCKPKESGAPPCPCHGAGVRWSRTHLCLCPASTPMQHMKTNEYQGYGLAAAGAGQAGRSSGIGSSKACGEDEGPGHPCHLR